MLAEIRQNIRLRLGLWLIIVIVLTYGLLLLQDYEAELQKEYQIVVEQLQQSQQVVEQPEWFQRVETMRNLLIQLESHLWQANTEGLAQASLHSWLNASSHKLKLSIINIQVDPPIYLEQANLWQVKAQVESEFESKKLYDLLLMIAETQEWLIIQRLEISLSTKTPHFKIFLTAYFQANTTKK